MILQKIRGFFEWLGKRSMAKSRKALNYEWTTMRPEGETPVKTVNIDEPPTHERPAPVKAVDVPVTKSDAAVSAPTPAEPDVEKQMAAILKEFTVSAAIQLLQGKFEKAADVRRSRMALFTFLKDNPEAVAFLQEQAKQKKAAKKPAKKTTTAKKTARRTAIKQAAAESSAEGKTEKPVAKKPAAKKAAPKKSATKPVESKEVVQSAVEKPVDANQKTEEPAPAVKPAPRKTTVKRTAAKKTVSVAEMQQTASAKKPAACKTAVKKPAVRKAAPKTAEESKPAEPAPDAEKTSA